MEVTGNLGKGNLGGWGIQEGMEGEGVKEAIAEDSLHRNCHCKWSGC